MAESLAPLQHGQQRRGADHRARRPRVVVPRHAGGDRIEQQHRLRGLPRRHQRWMRALDGDVAVRVAAEVEVVGVGDAVPVDQARQPGHQHRTTAVAGFDDADLRVRIQALPL